MIIILIFYIMIILYFQDLFSIFTIIIFRDSWRKVRKIVRNQKEEKAIEKQVRKNSKRMKINFVQKNNNKKVIVKIMEIY